MYSTRSPSLEQHLHLAVSLRYAHACGLLAQRPVWASPLSNHSAGDQRHARQMSGSPNMPTNRYQTRPSSASHNRPTRSGRVQCGRTRTLRTALSPLFPSVLTYYRMIRRGRHVTSSPTNNTHTQPIVSRLLYTVY